MRIEQRIFTAGESWQPAFSGTKSEKAQLVLLFGASELLRETCWLNKIRGAFPHAHLFGCSTAGAICDTRITEDCLVSTAIEFAHTSVHASRISLHDVRDSFEAGKTLARGLRKEGLVHVIALSDGIHINGSEFVKGLSADLPEGVSVTGGLAGDGEGFRNTYVLCDSNPETHMVAAIGFYGERLRTGYGCHGGWDPFGPERIVTRSNGNILYEFDGKSALELYKTYLGEHSHGLPAAGLLFPLKLRTEEGDRGVVRTIISIDEKEQSMKFAGDIPEGSYARLMKANFDRLIDGSMNAAKASFESLGSVSPDLAILISCVGRKMVLKQRTEEEVEGVREILGNQPAMTGFYSNGEICPVSFGTVPELHNQTMAITVLSEE